MKPTIIKDLEPTYKEVLCNLAKEKSKKLSSDNKILRKKVSRGTQKIKNLTLSREKTRAKNVSHYAIIKSLCNKLKPKRHHYTALVMELAVMLRVFTGSSFRSISMILTLLKDYLYLEGLRISCANTILITTLLICIIKIILIIMIVCTIKERFHEFNGTLNFLHSFLCNIF